MPLNERGKPMRWLTLNSSKRRMRWLLLTVSLTGCQPISGNQYFCPPTITFDQNGLVQAETYAVDRACFKSMTAKLQACYSEAR